MYLGISASTFDEMRSTGALPRENDFSNLVCTLVSIRRAY
jgi:hypothetical protein